VSEARIKARRLGEEAEMLAAAADMEEQLAAAKQAYDSDPTPENAAARSAAMNAMAEFRAWVRGVDRLRKVRNQLTDPRLHAGRGRALVERELADLEERYGELADGLDQLKASAGRTPLPPGSVEVVPAPARRSAKVHKPGGGS
jgi:hypothetical protein